MLAQLLTYLTSICLIIKNIITNTSHGISNLKVINRTDKVEMCSLLDMKVHPGLAIEHLPIKNRKLNQTKQGCLPTERDCSSAKLLAIVTDKLMHVNQVIDEID